MDLYIKANKIFQFYIIISADVCILLYFIFYLLSAKKKKLLYLELPSKILYLHKYYYVRYNI